MYAQPLNQTLLEVLQALRDLNSVFGKTLEAILPKKIEDEWLHTEDVMRIFKKSERTIYTWRKEKRIKYTNIRGTIYYLKSDIYAYLNK